MMVACGGPSTPAPPYTRQPTNALSEIAYPPPPARVETVPKRPRGDAVWIDGEWVWQTRRWRWRAGRWVVPPRGARFAPWTTVRDAAGTLYLASGTWRDASGREIESPAAIDVAEPNEGAIVTQEGDTEPNATTLPIDAGPSDARAPTLPAVPAQTEPVETPLPADGGLLDAARGWEPAPRRDTGDGGI